MHGKLYLMGFRGRVARSTLAAANESRDWRIYSDFAQGPDDTVLMSYSLGEGKSGRFSRLPPPPCPLFSKTAARCARHPRGKGHTAAVARIHRVRESEA